MTDTPTPYDLIGGEAVVREIVDRFYDLMDSLPEVKGLRAMHAADLGPMRDRLTAWLVGWLGGPPIYEERFGHVCIASAHAPFAIDATAREHWLLCMLKAIDESAAPPDLKTRLHAPMRRMAEMLQNR